MTVRETASAALQAIFAFPSTARLPIASNKLLTKIISWSITNTTDHHTSLKLTDLKVLEDILVEFSKQWEHGNLTIEYDKSAQLSASASQLAVTKVQVLVDRSARKRKRENSAERTWVFLSVLAFLRNLSPRALEFKL